MFAPAEDGGGGVRVSSIMEDPSKFNLVHKPGHPDAIKEGPLKGMVRYPNIDLAIEYVDAIEASRAYEANLAAFNVGKSMIMNSLKLLA